MYADFVGTKQKKMRNLKSATIAVRRVEYLR